MADINASQLVGVSVQTDTPAFTRVSQVAIVTVSNEPNFAAHIDASATAIIAASSVTNESVNAHVQTVAIVTVSQELSYIEGPRFIRLPDYLFSCIRFLIER